MIDLYRDLRDAALDASDDLDPDIPDVLDDDREPVFTCTVCREDTSACECSAP